MTSRSLKVSAVIAVGVFALSSCGGGDIASRADVVKFCGLAKEMEAASASDGHGEDPAAITDPAKMKEAWTTIVDLALKMRAGSPTEIKSEVELMVGSVVEMNSIFEKNEYDLLAMAKDTKVREALAKVTGDKTVQSASATFNTFMAKNCK